MVSANGLAIWHGPMFKLFKLFTSDVMWSKVHPDTTLLRRPRRVDVSLRQPIPTAQSDSDVCNRAILTSFSVHGSQSECGAQYRIVTAQTTLRCILPIQGMPLGATPTQNARAAAVPIRQHAKVELCHLLPECQV